MQRYLHTKAILLQLSFLVREDFGGRLDQAAFCLSHEGWTQASKVYEKLPTGS